MKLKDWQAERLLKIAKFTVVLKMSVTDKPRHLNQQELIELIPSVRVYVGNNPSICLPSHWQIVEDVEITEVVLQEVTEEGAV